MQKTIITCEHAGNNLPKKYKEIIPANVLQTHRGLDIGVYNLAKAIAKVNDLPFYYSKISRLLVELNRSPQNPDLFSEFTNFFDENEKKMILQKYYEPYRDLIEAEILAKIRKQYSVLHLSIHSFTPVFDGVERQVDIGVLFDPQRNREHKISDIWIEELKQLFPNWSVLKNEPYKGVEDGFTTYLRKKTNDSDYAGIELEVNQKHLISAEKNKIIKKIANSVHAILNHQD
jgi:predicted N-formylglutamate amidohydrolase